MSHLPLSSGMARAAIVLSGLWGVGCLVVAAYCAVRNPMDARERALEARVGAITFVPEVLPEPENAPLSAQRKVIVGKETLWRPLVAAPAAAPAPETKPDLLEKLKGVTLSLRDQIRTGDSLKIKAHISPEDKRGRWVAVGDKINGLTIAEIGPEVVIFMMEQNGKQFTAELPRR